MKITFLGAAKVVTGSCYLVETGKTKFLVDCGMFQGHADENNSNAAPFPFAMDEVDFLLLTHAHIDHSGRIPKLWLDGFSKPIFATKATADLCGIMLPDSGHIQEMEAEWENRKRMRSGKPDVQPLYTARDALACQKLFHRQKYGEEFTPADGVRVIFLDAGHILGSSIVEIWVSEGGKESKIVFSGDLGNKDIPIMRDPAAIDSADFLVVESTYGDRLHDNRVNKLDRFVQIISDTIARGGNVVIPSFAVGRTQEIIYELHKEREKYGAKLQAILNIPVYIDSPLAVSATEVFRDNTDCFDEEAAAYVKNGDNPLDFPNLHFIKTMEESKALNDDRNSKIIISASGMCDAGRIKHHLKHNLWRKDSTILFVGYQAEGTLGRQLVEGAKHVKLFGEDIRVSARVESIEGFSGHADRDGLLAWIDAFQTKPARIILVHGEDDAIKSFSASIEQRFHIKAEAPSIGESITLGEAMAETRAPAAAAAQPEANARKLASVELLDALNAEFSARLEGLKEELRKAASPQDVEKAASKIKAYGKYLHKYSE